jgi:hypothetical protein
MNRKLTIGLVIVFAVLLLYVLVIQRPKDLAADLTPTPRVTAAVWTVTAEQVSGFRLEDRVNGRAVAVARDAGGAWTLAEPGPQPADQTAATSAVSGLVGLTVANTITSTTDLTLFGVLSPTYQLEINLLDGSQVTAAIGDKTPTGTAYYVLRAGEVNVITVNALSLDPILALLDNPPIVQPTATEVVTGTVEAPAAETPGVTPTATP